MLKNKNKGRRVLIFALSALFLLSGIFSTGAVAAGKLADIQGHWAQQAIAEMYHSGIIAGYPEGVFLPNNSVTKLESVALLIRMLGLEKQALAMENTSVDYAIPPLKWGRGYLLMGVQEGMLDKDYLLQLGPGEPATRAEVAVLVYHAFNFSEEDESYLTFNDTAQIPQAYRSCVAAVVKSGLMQGLPGNVFEPNDEINRGQMAVLLSRVLEYNYGGAAVLANRYTGTITELLALEQSGWLVSISGSVSKSTAAGCEVFLDGKVAGPDDLKVADRVKLLVNESEQIVFIEATRTGSGTITDPSLGADNTYKGKVESILQVGDSYWLGITALDGNQVTRSVASGVVVDKTDRQDEISSLSRGDYVEVKVQGDKIVEINTLSLTTLKGTVSTIRSSSLTVYDENYSETTLNPFVDVVVVKDTTTVSWDDIKENNRVELKLLDKTVLRVDILRAPNVEGTIKELSTSGSYIITIRDSSGYTRDYVAAADLEVRHDGVRINFTSLREGDQVQLELNSNNRVVYIEVVDADSNKLVGDIRYLYTTGTWGINITADDGERYYYTVDSDVEVRRNSRSIYFDELRDGERVKMEMNSRQQIVYIEVVANDSDTVEGEIIDLITGSSRVVVLERSNGSSTRYYIASDAEYKRDGVSLRLRDIVIGSEVELEIEDGEVSMIDVIDDEDITVPGTVTYVSNSSRKITIEQLSGNEFSYSFTSDAVLKDSSNRTITLSDVEDDWEVELQLYNGRVERLTQKK